MVYVDRGLWGYEITGEQAERAAAELEKLYNGVDRLAACTPDLNYPMETENFINKIETKYNVKIHIK